MAPLELDPDMCDGSPLAGATIVRASGRSSAPSAAAKASRPNSAESDDARSSVLPTEAYESMC